MKNIIIIIFLTIGFVLSLNALPSCYHTYDQIGAELLQIEQSYPQYAKRYVIGHSQLDNIPIYAMKITNNPELENPNKPVVLFIGQVHAEEVLGVETTLSNIHEIINNAGTVPYGLWLSKLEIWFIPTLNPEGHNVVTSDMDFAYRKNKMDANHNGIFDYVVGAGYDIDGVDINRNVDFNWIHGDAFGVFGGVEHFDYYRGEAPWSESETQAFRDFCYAHKPVFSIVWHSSRNIQGGSGGLSQKVFYPLNWNLVRPSPDIDLGLQIGTGVSSQIMKISGGSYDCLASQGRKGDLNSWMYKEFGTICLVIECGQGPQIQPDTTGTDVFHYVINNNTNGVKWLLNRALNSGGTTSHSMLHGTIKDINTNLPLEAQIIIEGKEAPWYGKRMSDPVTGKYWRPVHTGTYNLTFRKKGYMGFTWENFDVRDNTWTQADVTLNPLPAVILHGTVRNSANNQMIPAYVKLYDVDNDSLDTNGEFIFNTYVGAHRIEVKADGYYPYVDTLDVNWGTTTLNVNIALSPATTLLSEDWENGTSNWTIQGPWQVQNQIAINGYAITDSVAVGENPGFYAENCNVWIKTNNPVAIPSTGQKMLYFDEHLYTEFVYDSVRVEVSTDNTLWNTIYSNSGKYDWWHQVYIPLDQFYGQSLYFRFRLTDQSTDSDLTDPGWTIDNIKIVSGESTLTPNSDNTTPTAQQTALYPNYPNPFSKETGIKFSTTAKGTVCIEIYNLKGQKVRQLTREVFKSGNHELKWDGLNDNGKAVTNGIYFCKLSSADKIKTIKMMLLK